jgi:pimeloyl-ACP methyl ester carboxylesterase
MPSARFVLVHGMYSSRTMWRPQHQALREAGYVVATPDLPGHGRRLRERFELEAALDTIDEAVNAARESPLAPPGPVILVGLSLGGYLSVEYAGRHPERIDGLIPMACSARPLAIGIALYRQVAGAMLRMPDRGMRADATAQRLVGGRAAAVAFLAGGHAVDAALDEVATVKTLDPVASLHRIADARAPTWFVNGELDQMRIDQRRFASIANAWRTVVPGAPHLVSLAAPRTVSRLLLMAGASSSW